MADYWEVFGWPREQYGQNGQFYGQRKLLCEWKDRKAVLLEIAGNGGQLWPYEVIPGGGDYMPGHDGEARAFSCLIEPFRSRMSLTQTTNKFASYEWAILTFEYSTTTAIKLSDTWVTEELQPTGRLVNVDITDRTWTASGDTIEPADNIIKWETSFDYVVKYHHLLSIPAAAYMNCNKVNSDVVGSALIGLTFAPGTLLHTRPVVSRSFDPGLLNTFELTYRFPFNPNGWNKFWDNTNGVYDFLDGDTLTSGVYEGFNFSSLVP